jgi:hypothetical protein
MKNKMFRCVILLCAWSINLAVSAQATCPPAVQRAFETAQRACTNLERNQACYGNVALTLTTRSSVHDARFEQVGDIIDLIHVENIELAHDANGWGVALARLQANLPDTLPGQAVTMVLFGDVNVTNAVPADAQITVRVVNRGRLRSTPSSVNNANIVQTIEANTQLTAIGRTEPNDWILVQVGNQTGWLSTQVTSGDTTALPIVTDPNAPLFSQPLQAFYMTSGIGDSPCVGLPSSGILLQTPKGSASITLSVNGVTITLGSTVYLQATDAALRVFVLEGRATVQAQSAIALVAAGTWTTVPLDVTGRAPASAPTAPQPYDPTDLDGLPLGAALLPQVVAIANPVPVADLPQAIDSAFALNGGGLSGLYRFTRSDVQVFVENSSVGNCRNYYSADFTARLTFDDSLTLEGVQGDMWFSSQFFQNGRITLPREGDAFGNSDALQEAYTTPPQRSARQFWNSAETIRVVSPTEVRYQRTESTNFEVQGAIGNYACRYVYTGVWVGF